MVWAPARCLLYTSRTPRRQWWLAVIDPLCLACQLHLVTGGAVCTDHTSTSIKIPPLQQVGRCGMVLGRGRLWTSISRSQYNASQVCCMYAAMPRVTNNVTVNLSGLENQPGC